MAGDDEFEIDLTNFGGSQDWSDFEKRQKEAYEGEHHPGVESSDEEIAPPWDDQRSFEDLWSEESIWKASLLLKSDRVHVEGPNHWVVEGSEIYQVHRLGSEEILEVPWYTCTCPNGAARGGRPSCYHTAAVAALDLGIDISGAVKPEKKRPARG